MSVELLSDVDGFDIVIVYRQPEDEDAGPEYAIVKRIVNSAADEEGGNWYIREDGSGAVGFNVRDLSADVGRKGETHGSVGPLVVGVDLGEGADLSVARPTPLRWVAQTPFSVDSPNSISIDPPEVLDALAILTRYIWYVQQVAGSDYIENPCPLIPFEEVFSEPEQNLLQRRSRHVKSVRPVLPDEAASGDS